MAVRAIARHRYSRILRHLSSANVSPIAAPLGSVEELITPEDFARSYLRKSRPGFFPSLVKAQASPYRWPACDEWTTNGHDLSGLKKIQELQNVVVDVEISPPGRGYGDAVKSREANGSKWMKVQMPFGTFLEAFIEGDIPWQSDGDQERPVGYVAQQDLFEKSLELIRQCPPLPHTIAGERGAREQWRRNVWIGGANSFTPIHCDPYENVYVQVVGSKRVHLFHPSVAPLLHLFSSSTSQGNTSSIPSEDVLMRSGNGATSLDFPSIGEALSHPDTRQTILKAGDVLYIPKGWYHCFRSLSISASVNAWFR